MHDTIEKLSAMSKRELIEALKEALVDVGALEGDIEDMERKRLVRWNERFERAVKRVREEVDD